MSAQRRGSGWLRTARPGSDPHLHITGKDRVLVVHAGNAPSDHLADAAAELRRSQPADQATVLVGGGFGAPEALYAVLVPALTAARKSGVRTVRLAMARAAEPGGGVLAQAVAEAVGCDLFAPAGLVVIIPGGTLFAPDLPSLPGGWWHFSPGLAPRHTGTRLPEPSWQAAVERTAPLTAEGCVVEQVPAGLMVLPPGVPAEGADALRYAVPPDPAGPLVLVGSTLPRSVPADALAEVIAALPGTVRSSVRLATGDGTDPLPAGQGVANLLGIPVRVVTGLPLLLDAPSAPAGSPRMALTDAKGEPTWQPYVEAVTCTPANAGAARAAAPTLGAWRPPIGGLRPGLEPGAMMLDRQWEVVVTRAGLWVGPNGAAVPEEISHRQVDNELMALDVGRPEEPFDSDVWEALDRLFTALQDDVRQRTFVQLHGECTTDDLRDLRRLAMRHDLAVAPRDWRSTACEDSAPQEADTHLANVLPLAPHGEAAYGDDTNEPYGQESEFGAKSSAEPFEENTQQPRIDAMEVGETGGAPSTAALDRIIVPVFTPGPLPSDVGPTTPTETYTASVASGGWEADSSPVAVGPGPDAADAEPMGVAGALVAGWPSAFEPTFNPPVVPPLAGQTAVFTTGGGMTGNVPDRETSRKPRQTGGNRGPSGAPHLRGHPASSSTAPDE